jgi:hypothetical protein
MNNPDDAHVSLGGTKVGELVCMPKEKRVALIAVADAAEVLMLCRRKQVATSVEYADLETKLRAAGRLTTEENSDAG